MEGVQVEEEGEWWLSVQTTADRLGCAGCGTRAVSHGRRHVRVRDVAMAGRPVVLCWAKRVWRCPDPDCGVGTCSEASDLVEPGGLLTVRAAREICRLVGEDGMSVAAVARRFGVSWAAAMAALRRRGTPLVDDPARLEGVSALGADETTLRHAGPRSRTRYVTGLVDLQRGRLLDVLDGRSGAVVADWLAGRPEASHASNGRTEAVNLIIEKTRRIGHGF